MENMLGYYMQQAWDSSKTSNCLKKRVGAVLVDPRYAESPSHRYGILSYGYGGSHHGCEICLRKEKIWTQDGCWSIHAEIRAIFYYFKRFSYTEDLSHTVMITTHGPCDQCLKYMEYFKIPLVYYDKDYKTDYSVWSNYIKVMKYIPEKL